MIEQWLNRNTSTTDSDFTWTFSVQFSTICGGYSCLAGTGNKIASANVDANRWQLANLSTISAKIIVSSVGTCAYVRGY